MTLLDTGIKDSCEALVIMSINNSHQYLKTSVKALREECASSLFNVSGYMCIKEEEVSNFADFDLSMLPHSCITFWQSMN